MHEQPTASDSKSPYVPPESENHLAAFIALLSLLLLLACVRR